MFELILYCAAVVMFLMIVGLPGEKGVIPVRFLSPVVVSAMVVMLKS